MSWYLFEQNNSGGVWVINSILCHRLWVEADTDQQANEKFEELGGYFDGVEDGRDCPCCGDRWYKVTERTDRYLAADMEESIRKSHRIFGKTFNSIWRMIYKNGDIYELSFDKDGNQIENLKRNGHS